MSKLTAEHVSTIAAAILSQPDDEQTSWEEIRAISLKVTGKKFTRQTLHSYDQIREAYANRLAAFRKRKRTKRKEVVRVGDPKDRRIQSLQEEVNDLKAKLNAYDIRFVLLLENTKRLGFKREELLRPLPPSG